MPPPQRAAIDGLNNLVDGEVDRALRARGEGALIPIQARRPGELQRRSGAPVGNQQTAPWVDVQISQCHEHRVAQVIGPAQQLRRQQAQKTRVATAMRRIGVAVTVGGSDDEGVGHRNRLLLSVVQSAPATRLTGRAGADF